MTVRFSKAGLSTACTALLVGLAILVAPMTPAVAAPQERPRAGADLQAAAYKLAQAEPTTTSSLAKAPLEEAPACDRARRRLWVECEGRFLRRCSSCH